MYYLFFSKGGGFYDIVFHEIQKKKIYFSVLSSFNIMILKSWVLAIFSKVSTVKCLVPLSKDLTLRSDL